MREQTPVVEMTSLLHSFGQDERERRQYRRVEMRFEVWWLRDFKGLDAVSGVGIEISAGGLQFLLKERVADQCAIVFKINAQRMRANVLIIASDPFEFEGQTWIRYRAKFVGLMQMDFDILVALTGRPIEAASEPAQTPREKRNSQFSKKRSSLGAVESYDMLPLATQDKIIDKLVQMKRLTRPAETAFAHLAAHYGGFHRVDADTIYHRFFVRSRLGTGTGIVVYNTEILVSDDGVEVIARN